MTRSGIVTARGLTKDYGQGRGIFDVSFAVEDRAVEVVHENPSHQRR